MHTIEAISHLVLPRHTNNYKAKILHSSSIFFVAMSLLALNFSLRHLGSPAGNVLGYAANISPTKVIELTNQKRVEDGEGALKYNEELSKAAKLKGEDMLAKDYWAHVSPDGVEPWSFFKNVGYTYRFAGENLARDFNSPESTVDAWMASPSHRENMLSARYTEIGVAVLEGDLGGKDTTLVVQLFGTPSTTTPTVSVASTKTNKPLEVAAKEEIETVVSSPDVLPVSNNESLAKTKGLVGQFDVMKTVTASIIFGMFALLLVDLIFISRRGITRVGGRAFAHLSFVAMIFIILLIIKSGEIV